MPCAERTLFKRLTNSKLRSSTYIRVLLAVYNRKIPFPNEPVFKASSKRIIAAVDDVRSQPPSVAYPLEHCCEQLPRLQDQLARTAIAFSIIALREIINSRLTRKLRKCEGCPDLIFSNIRHHSGIQGRRCRDKKRQYRHSEIAEKNHQELRGQLVDGLAKHGVGSREVLRAKKFSELLRLTKHFLTKPK
jgi:hypothetical protein